MKGMRIILFLVTIPLLVAVGHDAYLNIHNNEDEIKLSAVGFVWIQNHPQSFNQLREMLEPNQWQLLNDYVFEQKSIIVAGVFAGVFYVLAGLLWLLNSGKQKRNSVKSMHRNKKIDVILGEAEERSYKYKRK